MGWLGLYMCRLFWLVFGLLCRLWLGVAVILGVIIYLGLRLLG